MQVQALSSYELGPGIPTLKKLASEGRSGALTATGPEGEIQINLQNGRVVWARSSNADDRLGGVLLRLGFITLPELAAATNVMVREQRRLGSILLERESIEFAHLRRGLSEQVIQMASRALLGSGHDYQFGPGEFESDDLTPNLAVNYVIWRAGSGNIPVSRLLAELGGTSGVFRRTPSFAAEIIDLVLDDDDREVVTELSDELSLLQLCTRCSVPDYRICRLLWVLTAIGAVERVD